MRFETSLILSIDCSQNDCVEFSHECKTLKKWPVISFGFILLY